MMVTLASSSRICMQSCESVRAATTSLPVSGIFASAQYSTQLMHYGRLHGPITMARFAALKLPLHNVASSWC